MRGKDRGDGPSPEGKVSAAAWLDALDAHALTHGFHARLGATHGAVYTEEEPDRRLVTFENAETIRAGGAPHLPHGLRLAGREGWSQLCLYSDGTTWFRDPEVYAFIDDLVDDGFFDLFDRVLFYGAGPEGYAACAYSVAAPGGAVLAIRPQATLDPACAIWDRRHLSGRRRDFAGRYGYAPHMVEAAETVSLVYDPFVAEDAMHAALFGPQAQHFRTPRLGERPEVALAEMGSLWPMVRAAALGRLDRAGFARLWRRRHGYGPYLRAVHDALEAQGTPLRRGLWCRKALEAVERAAYRDGLSAAEAALAAEGKRLPPARSSDAA